MGFFSGLCSFVSSAASAVGGAVKSVVGGVAKGIGKAVKEIVANSPDIFKGPDIIDIINFFRDLFGNSSSIYDAKKTYNLMQSLSIIC